MCNKEHCVATECPFFHPISEQRRKAANPIRAANGRALIQEGHGDCWGEGLYGTTIVMKGSDCRREEGPGKKS